MKNEKPPTGKFILDCCCGSKMFHFNKNHPHVLYADIRKEEVELCDGRKMSINPDIVMDFTDMPFADNSFKMVIFDPPHLHKLGKNTWMAQKYGVLLPTWETDIRAGFNECMRVLDKYGTLIFKWNEHQISLHKLLSVINFDPLVGHTSSKHGKTIWLTFIKL